MARICNERGDGRMGLFRLKQLAGKQTNAQGGTRMAHSAIDNDHCRFAGLTRIGGWLTPIPYKSAAGGLSWRQPRPAEAYLMMAGLVVAATLVRLAIDPFVFGAQFDTFFLAVIGSAVLGGMCAGLLSLVLSMLSAWYFFVGTQYSFVLAEGEGYSLILFVVIATVIVFFIGSLQAVLAEEIAIKTRAETVEMFARELQHRVRNNLHHIQAMLDSHASTIPAGEPKQHIETIISRIATMTHMYDHLLGVGLDGTIDFADYLRTLCIRLSDIQGGSHNHINLVCTTESTKLNLDTVTSVGLVVAELVTNSYGHAFPDGRSGTITVALSGVDAAGMVTLTIADDGVGFDDKPEGKRHGMGLTRRILATVNGTIVLASDHGTRWTMTIPAGSAGSDGTPPVRPH